jgi:hypothetical protein
MLNTEAVVRGRRRAHPERAIERQMLVSGIRIRKELEMEQV